MHYEIPTLLKMETVAHILGVNLQRAYQMAREGLLPVVRLGRQIRVNERKLAAWIEQGGQALPDNHRCGSLR